MPDFRGIDAVPAGDFAGPQEIIDRRRAGAPAVFFAVAEGLAEVAALGVGLEAEQADDIVRGHGVFGGMKGFAAPRPTTARMPAATPRASDKASCLRPSKT